MADDPAKTCLNCGHPVELSYCPNCGQKNTDYRVSLWQVLKEVAAETFELDGRVARTLVPFLFKPGTLTREYMAGKRATYTSPFRLFLAMTLFWVAAGFVGSQTTDFEKQAEMLAEQQVSLPKTDPEGKPIEESDELFSDLDDDSPRWQRQLNARYVEFKALEPAKQQEVVYKTVIDALPKAALALLPLFALVLKILFLGTGRYYVEHLVFALHVHAFGFLLLTPTMLLQDEDALGTLIFLALLTYVFVGLKRAYDASWWATALRFMGLFVAYFVLATITVLAFLGVGLFL